MTAENRCRLGYVVADYLSTNIAVAIFNVIRYYQLPVAFQSYKTLGEFLGSRMPVAGQILFPLVMMIIYYMSGNYMKVFLRSRAGELLSTMFSSFVGTLILIFVALINDLTLDRTHDYELFIVLFLLIFTCVYLPRLILTVYNQRKLKKGEVFFPTVIIGYGSYADLFRSQKSKLFPKMGMKTVGFVDYENRGDTIVSIDGLPVENFNDIERVCADKDVSQIIVIPHPDGIDRTLDVVSKLYALDRPVYIAGDNLPSYVFRNQILNMKAEPYIDVTGGRLKSSTICSKRVADIVISALTLTLIAVPMAIIATIVKFDSRGPVFYRQTRVGRGHKYFSIIKFRTMYSDSESDGCPALSHSGDDRVTRSGRVLRKYRLDELPQFVNVLLGDMSIVGPRPERPYFVEKISEREPAYPLIHRVRPGITSLGMVKYGYASSVDAMVTRSRYDLLYLDNLSIVTDLKIILYTIRTVITGKGV